MGGIKARLLLTLLLSIERELHINLENIKNVNIAILFLFCFCLFVFLCFLFLLFVLFFLGVKSNSLSARSVCKRTHSCTLRRFPSSPALTNTFSYRNADCRSVLSIWMQKQQQQQVKIRQKDKKKVGRGRMGGCIHLIVGVFFFQIAIFTHPYL